MYRSKRQGGNSYQFYSAGMQVTATERLALKQDLQQALERKEFQLYYQPQLDLHTEQLRVRSPEMTHLLVENGIIV